MTASPRHHAALLFATFAILLFPPLACAVTGDYDNDGDFDLQDVAALQRCFGSSPPLAGCQVFDVNTDGAVGLDDYAQLVPAQTGPYKCPQQFIISPPEGALVPARRVTIVGTLPPGTAVIDSLDAEIRPSGTDTRFYVPASLTPGLNRVQITASDAGGSILCSGSLSLTRTADADPVSVAYELVPNVVGGWWRLWS